MECVTVTAWKPSPVQSFDSKGHKPVLNTADQHLDIEWPWDSSAQIPYHLVIQFPCFICGIQHRLALHATSVLTMSSGKSWPFKWPTTCVKNVQWVGGAFTAVVFSYQCTIGSSAMHCSGWGGERTLADVIMRDWHHLTPYLPMTCESLGLTFVWGVNFLEIPHKAMSIFYV